MRKTLKYIGSSIFALFFSANVSAADSTAVKRIYEGFFVDVDVIEPLVSVFNSNHIGANASLSFNLKNVFFPTVMVGYASYDASDDYSYIVDQPSNYSYKVKGPYFKAGLDFNLVKSTKQFKPACYLGARYAFSPFNYDLLNVKYSNEEWETETSFSSSGRSFAQWGEFLGGVRVPVYNRLYLGFEGNYKWSFHTKTDSFSKSDGSKVRINQSYAPGFGDSRGTCWGFRYMVSFFF